MILKLLLELIYALFYALTAVIQIGSMPTEVLSITQKITEAFTSGLAMLGNWVDVGYLLVLLGLIIAIDVGLFVYHFVMWVIRKIPMLGIS